MGGEWGGGRQRVIPKTSRKIQVEVTTLSLTADRSHVDYVPALVPHESHNQSLVLQISGTSGRMVVARAWMGI